VRELAGNFDVHVHGDGWPQEGITCRGLLSGEEAVCAISSAFLMVVFGLTAAGHPIVKPYLFDYTSAGALVATDIFPAVAKYFTYGKELIGFADTADLIRKIRYYLDHPEEAQQIRATGHERTLREYTWRRVWPKIRSQQNKERFRS
jgi:spore maturation protein CgeB